eukprot:Hpha_TRINITY_DN26728_c0_g1::TRINITY_DN26728_c0_g1_i1::g.138895::m.138895
MVSCSPPRFSRGSGPTLTRTLTVCRTSRRLNYLRLLCQSRRSVYFFPKRDQARTGGVPEPSNGGFSQQLERLAAPALLYYPTEKLCLTIQFGSETLEPTSGVFFVHSE